MGWGCDEDVNGNWDGIGNGMGIVIGIEMRMRIGMDGPWNKLECNFFAISPIVLVFSWVLVFRVYLKGQTMSVLLWV